MATAIPQEEASSSTRTSTYHVFLSFRGEDTRKNFTDHLHTALVQAGFHTFRDDDEIQRGGDIELEIQKAIKESRMSIIVFSKDYASSRWCLDELVMIMEHKRLGGWHVVLPIFYDVDPSHVRKQTGSFSEAFVRHEERFKKEEDRVEGWRAALREVAALGGMVLQDGYESKFIQNVVTEVGNRLNRAILNVDPYLVGIDLRVRPINLWLQDGSNDVGIATIYGIGGIGKTTIAKIVYNQNFHNFEGSSFLANIREISEQPNGLVCLQRQLLSDVMKRKANKFYSIDEGIIMIKDAICCKRVFLILDDVDQLDQVSAIMGMRQWFHPGSKIIITTRHEHLLRAHEVSVMFKVLNLNENESLQLFSWHAFGQNQPLHGYEMYSENVVHHCGGIPLALQVLGSSLYGQPVELWKRALQEPEAIDDGKIQKILRKSYDSLQDDRDKNLFLDIACFFIGKDKDYVDRIVEGCDFYRIFGIQKLIDRCLITIDKDNRLMMHQSLRDMGREIVRQESPEDLGKRSRLWRHKDSFSVLRKNTGTRAVKSLILDQQLINTALANNADLQTKAFVKMRNLKLLDLSNVKLKGSYADFPKSLVWLRWHGFPLNFIPDNFSLEDLIILDMQRSSLKCVLKGTQVLANLKILDLSHSHGLVNTSDLSGLLGLEMLILKYCINLMEVHESIGNLGRLVLLNLKGCKNLIKLPTSIGLLKSLDKLILSGCSKLGELPEELGTLQCLRVLRADETAINRLQSWQLNCWSWLFPRRSPQSTSFSFTFLPCSLVKLSLADCNITNDVIPDDLSSLPCLEYLNLSKNPIQTLPESMKNLSMLQDLLINHCRSLLSVPELPTSLKKLRAEKCLRLERIANLPNLLRSLRLNLIGCKRLVQVQGLFNLELMGDFNAEMIGNLHLFNMECLGSIEVEMINSITKTSRITPLQILQEHSIFSFFLPGSEVPSWYSHQKQNNSISFDVPPLLSSKICGLNLCIVYQLCDTDKQYATLYPPDVEIGNKTKVLKWSYSPIVYGVPRIGEDMLWLSHWRFGTDRLEGGDQVNVSASVTPAFQVKKCGVHLVCEPEENLTHCQNRFSKYKKTNMHFISTWPIHPKFLYLPHTPPLPRSPPLLSPTSSPPLSPPPSSHTQKQ